MLSSVYSWRLVILELPPPISHEESRINFTQTLPSTFQFKDSQHLQISHQVTMRLQSRTLLALFTLCLSTGLAIPLADPGMDSSPITDGPKLERREPHPKAEPRSPPNPPSPPPNPNCPKQKPIAQNLCTSGSPYCCSGTGASQVCGPASSTSCSSTTICCINTNGVSQISLARTTSLLKKFVCRCRFVLERLTSLGQ
jgi:hypothetical protein